MKISEMTREDLSERLIISVVNAEESQDRLLNYPHNEAMGFSMLAQLCLGEKNFDGIYTSCITVTNDLMNTWNMTKNELFMLATENSKKIMPAVLEPISMFLNSQNFSNFMQEGVDMANVYVLSNKAFFNGAASIFYDTDVLKEKAQELQDEGFYLLPSSTNHMYCIPAKAGYSAEELQELFKEFSSEIEANERLCESILHYNAKNDSFVVVNENYNEANVIENNVAANRHGR